jgi:hypothetical protein
LSAIHKKSALKRAGIAALICFCFHFTLQAQQKKFVVPVEFMVENGSAENTSVKIFEEGVGEWYVKARDEMTLKLNFNRHYLITFIKKNYITKTIDINTYAPDSRRKRKIEAYPIGVKLFKQYAGVNIVIYNQPVAKIQYDPSLDEFNYDTDYTKSIFNLLSKTEKELERLAARDRTGQYLNHAEDQVNLPSNQVQSMVTDSLHPENPAVEKEKDGNQYLMISGEPRRKTPGDIPPGSGIDATSNVDSASGEESENNKKLSGRSSYDSNDAQLSYGSDGNVNKNMHGAEGSENYSESDSTILPDHVIYYRDKFRERNCIVTLLKIANGLNTEEYRKVEYDWGGVYYFKDSFLTISESMFELATGEK